MAMAKTARRPNLMSAQRREALAVLRGQNVKVVSTFPRKMTPYDAKVRKFQKRTVDVYALLHQLKSGDPVLKNLARDRLLADEKNLRNIGLPTLEAFSRDGDWAVRAVAAKGLGQIGERGLPLVKGLMQDDHWSVRRIALASFAKFVAKKGDLAALEKLVNDDNSVVRIVVARELAQMGKKGLHYLKILARDKDWSVREIAEEELSKDADLNDPESAVNAIQKAKGRKLLLRTRKPFAATAYLHEMIKRAKTLNEVSAELKQKFGNGFTGIVAFGSMAEGYATPLSDIDSAVIASNPAVEKEFITLCEKKGLPVNDSYFFNPKESGPSNAKFLFQGLFFGNRAALREAQRNAFVRMNETQWNAMRKSIFESEAYLDKAFERFGIKSKLERQRLKAAAALRVPPPYDEMKKLLGIQ